MIKTIALQPFRAKRGNHPDAPASAYAYPLRPGEQVKVYADSVGAASLALIISSGPEPGTCMVEKSRWHSDNQPSEANRWLLKDRLAKLGLVTPLTDVLLFPSLAGTGLYGSSEPLDVRVEQRFGAIYVDHQPDSHYHGPEPFVVIQTPRLPCMGLSRLILEHPS